MSEVSLRERSKARRRDAIVRAAMRLFTANGYDATTISEIAAAAEVSPRTVSLYFPAKIDLVMSHVDEVAQRALATLAKQRRDETFADLLSRWLREEDDRTDPELRLLQSAMFAANPGLRALRNVRTEDALQAGRRVVAEQIGQPEHSFAVRIAIAAAVGVLEECAVSTVEDGNREAVRATVVTFLAAGLGALAHTQRD